MMNERRDDIPTGPEEARDVPLIHTFTGVIPPQAEATRDPFTNK
jgi:hypothetical protein